MAKREGSFKWMFLIMGFSLLIASLWNDLPWLKNFIHLILDPTAGALLNWNLTLGMTIIVFIISLATILVQKYATDQKALKELRKEQKLLQKQMNEYKDHPEKLLELQKRNWELVPKTMKLSTRAIVYTGVPFILLYRWFDDYFLKISSATGHPVRFLGFMGWFIFYLVGTLVFSSILKKALDVV